MKTALLLCTYNRPEYLKECLESLSRADFGDINGVLEILVVDDGSNQETLSLLGHFKHEVGCRRWLKGERLGIKDSLLKGYELLFERYDTVINLDSDAIVRNDCFTELIRLKTKYPDRIITGFHSTTMNKDGSERHRILEDWGDVFVKKSVGGINMVINRQEYEKYVKPSLLSNGNWDHRTSIAAEADCKNILSVKKSLVEHIGLTSAMGHNHDHPDVAEGFNLLSLPNVTLVGVDSINPHGLREAARISQQDIEFGAVKLFGPDITISSVMSKSAYSLFLLNHIYQYIDTDYMLVIQADGFVLNAKAWDPKWLEFDYIGSTWGYRDGSNVGNGGFSLRSKKLMAAVANDKKIERIKHPHNEILEDHIICRLNRKYLEKEYGINFAPAEVADGFAIEAYNGGVFPGDNKYTGQFGFHGFKVDFSEKGGYKPYKLPNKWKSINYQT